MTDAKIKAAVRDRDNNSCTECGITNEQHQEKFGFGIAVHRKMPGAKYTVGPGCVTLCHDCHKKAHKLENPFEGGQITIPLDADFIARIRQQTRGRGNDVRAYIRIAIARRLEADEAERAEVEFFRKAKRPIIRDLVKKMNAEEYQQLSEGEEGDSPPKRRK